MHGEAVVLVQPRPHLWMLGVASLSAIRWSARSRGVSRSICLRKRNHSAWVWLASVRVISLPVNQLAGQLDERGKQRDRAVADMVVGHRGRTLWRRRQAQLGALKRPSSSHGQALDLAFLVAAQHQRRGRGIDPQARGEVLGCDRALSRRPPLLPLPTLDRPSHPTSPPRSSTTPISAGICGAGH